MWGQHVQPLLFFFFYSLLFGLGTLLDTLCCSVWSYCRGCWVSAAFGPGFLKKQVKEGSSSEPVPINSLLACCFSSTETRLSFADTSKRQGQHSNDRKCLTIFLPLLYGE